MTNPTNPKSWYHFSLSAEQVAAGELQKRRDAFTESFAAARGPRTMALFQWRHADGGLDLYLTPDCGEHATELMAEWQCTPCERPLPTGLQLLVGHNEITYYMP